MKSRLQVVLPDDLTDLQKIAAARPMGRDVVAAAKRIPGAKVREYANGQFDVTASDTKAQHALAGFFETPRRLESERGDKLQARRHGETVEVINARGRHVRVTPEGETGAARAGLLLSPRKSFGSGRAPRCWTQGHDYRDGRCWWCGRMNGAQA